MNARREKFEERVDQLVLQIFADLDGAAGNPIPLELLKSRWTHLPRRTEELIESLRRMIFGGLLHLTHTHAGTALQLTPRGRRLAETYNHDLRSIWNYWVAAAFEAAPAQPAAMPG